MWFTLFCNNFLLQQFLDHKLSRRISLLNWYKHFFFFNCRQANLAPNYFPYLVWLSLRITVSVIKLIDRKIEVVATLFLIIVKRSNRQRLFEIITIFFLLKLFRHLHFFGIKDDSRLTNRISLVRIRWILTSFLVTEKISCIVSIFVLNVTFKTSNSFKWKSVNIRNFV